MSAITSSIDIVTNPQNKDPEKLIENLENQRKQFLQAVLNPTYAGPIFLLYAIRGRLTKLERILLGAIGVATILYTFRHHQYIKQIKERIDL